MIDCLFLVQYIPENTINPGWFLVQVNHIERLILKMDSSRTGDHHVTSLSRHSADKHLCDDVTRWVLSGTSIIWVRIIFLFMVLVCFLTQTENLT